MTMQIIVVVQSYYDILYFTIIYYPTTTIGTVEIYDGSPGARCAAFRHYWQTLGQTEIPHAGRDFHKHRVVVVAGVVLYKQRIIFWHII